MRAKWVVRRLLRVGVASSLLLGTRLSGAQAAPAAPPPAAPGPAQPTTSPEDEFVKQVMEGAEEPDLEWLFSQADEAKPTGLVGKPIPAPAFPERGEGSGRVWNPAWQRFGLGNYLLTGAGLAAAIGSALLPAGSGWRGPNPVDDWGRKNLGISPYENTLWAQDASDVLLSVAVAYPILIDSLIVTYWYRRSEDVAVQMALIDTEAMAVAVGIQNITAGLASRERPYGKDCGSTIDEDLRDCDSSKRFRSFFSGHTTMAFAAAGATCSNHAYHDVFGSPGADGVACAVALVNAAAVGTLRIVGDQHYVTDVATGAAVGTLSGLGLPWLLHYGPLARVSAGILPRSPISLSVVPHPQGLGLGGRF